MTQPRSQRDLREARAWKSPSLGWAAGDQDLGRELREAGNQEESYRFSCRGVSHSPQGRRGGRKEKEPEQQWEHSRGGVPKPSPNHPLCQGCQLPRICSAALVAYFLKSPPPSFPFVSAQIPPFTTGEKG